MRNDEFQWSTVQPILAFVFLALTVGIIVIHSKECRIQHHPINKVAANSTFEIRVSRSTKPSNMSTS